MSNEPEDREYSERLNGGAENMRHNGTSLDDATEKYGVDRNDLSVAFGKLMCTCYGRNDKDD